MVRHSQFFTGLILPAKTQTEDAVVDEDLESSAINPFAIRGDISVQGASFTLRARDNMTCGQSCCMP